MTSTPEPLPARATRREWVGLAVLALACLLYVMDLTVLHLAVPAISEDLQPTSTQLLWIIDIYGFFVAGSLITMGTLGDRLGRRRLLLFGAAGFGVFSVMAAFAVSAEMLILARALLGIAGATLAPATLSLIFHMFEDPRERSIAVGVWIGAFSAGAAIGPILGGIVLELFWWGAVFLLALPVMGLLLVLGPRVLPEYRDPEARRLDLPSAVMAISAVLSVIYGLKEIALHGFETLPGGAILFGLVVGALWAWRQTRLDDGMGAQFGQVGATQRDFRAVHGGLDTPDGLEQRGLAAAIGAKDDDDFRARDGERHIVDGAMLSVRHGEIGDLKHRCLPDRRAPLPGRPVLR